MEQTTEYTREQLENLSIAKLGDLYMSLFDVRPLVGQSSQLEAITEVLSERNDITEKIIIVDEINNRIRTAKKDKDNINALRYAMMLEYYEEHVI